MKITIQRYARRETATLGLLFLNGVFQCYTLEPLSARSLLDVEITRC